MESGTETCLKYIENKIPEFNLQNSSLQLFTASLFVCVWWIEILQQQAEWPQKQNNGVVTNSWVSPGHVNRNALRFITNA